MNKPAPKEPSMDEILSSIRQIIADDDAAGAPRRPSVQAAAPPMQAADSASIDAVRDWHARTQRFRPPVAALRASRLWGEDGRLIGQKPSPADSWNIPNPTPRWERVTCRSLGIYAMPRPYETYLRYWSSLDSLQQARAKDYYALFAAWTKKNRDAFARFTQNRVVEFPSASHMFFMEQPDEAARVIDGFSNRT